jgi:hypothetical protein
VPADPSWGDYPALPPGAAHLIRPRSCLRAASKLARFLTVRAAFSCLVGFVITMMLSPAAIASPETGELRLRDRTMQTNSVYIEGALYYVAVRRARDRRLVFHTRFGERLSRQVTVPSGYYEVTSWTRTCSGTCQNLDPPSLRCQGTVRVRAGRFITATIVHGVGLRCRVTNP